MLRLTDVTKVYSSGDAEVHALKGVSISFRKSEFVSILGHSGCGKTTLLNIIGGLDHYTTGDLIINDTSTKEYKDRDWDNYRNHSIGFVFQSYNLIPHQTVLGNVELALTLSGVNRAERKRLAQAALGKVGLADQINKLPNQLSGGQMQRVAIARALVNDPDIILADEPTGALDTETSVQVMDLLKEVSRDKLVIMVTHNPELAEQYSTRIVRLKDGEIISDSMPFEEAGEDVPTIDSEIKSSEDRSFDDEAPSATEDTCKKEESEDLSDTSLSRKKKKPSMSIFTAFMLSIRNLFTKKGRTFLTAFAGSIGIIGIALVLSLSNGFQKYINRVEEDTLSGYPFAVYETNSSLGLNDLMELFTDAEAETKNTAYPTEKKVYSNTLASGFLKKVRESASRNDLRSFKKWTEENADHLSDLTNAVKYTYNTKFSIFSVTKDDDGKTKDFTQHYPLDLDTIPSDYSMLGETMNSISIWEELVDSQEYLDQQYDVIEGRWPKKYESSDNDVYEVVLSVDKYNRIYDYLLYAIGFMSLSDIFNNREAIPTSYSFDELIGREYKIIANAEQYEKDEGGLWHFRQSTSPYLRSTLDSAVTIRIAGIIRPKEGVNAGSMTGAIGYTSELTDLMIKRTNSLPIVQEQIANTEYNVAKGATFEESETTYASALRALGVVDKESPSSILFYVKGFDEKQELIEMIDAYNASMAESAPEKQIKYTDLVGSLMSSVNTIINAISYVLIAFVSISLIVSSIMIGIITYISVLERTKEIGVLRSIGASKKDISRLFNAETLTVGFMSGVFGIIVTLLLNIPINLIIKSLTGLSSLAVLPVLGGVALVLISMFLSFIAGFIPSKIAAKKDPVVALRTE